MEVICNNITLRDTASPVTSLPRLLSNRLTIDDLQPIKSSRQHTSHYAHLTSNQKGPDGTANGSIFWTQKGFKWQSTDTSTDTSTLPLLCITCQGRKDGTGQDKQQEMSEPKIYAPPGMITEMCTGQRQLRYMCHKDYCYCRKPTAVASWVARQGWRNHIIYAPAIYVT